MELVIVKKSIQSELLNVLIVNGTVLIFVHIIGRSPLHLHKESGAFAVQPF